MAATTTTDHNDERLARVSTSRADEDAFRDRARAFLAEHATLRNQVDDPDEDQVDIDRSRRYQSALYAAGLAGITWPRAYGGLGLDVRYQTIFNDEAAAYHLPTRVFGVTFGMAVPVILAHGTEAQRRRYIEPALRGEEIWCQLFSEPGAGSDLASLRSSVVQDGDEWVLNGQKVWSSAAHHARFGLLLARSDFHQPKHRGLSMFLLDMESPGIDIRPLRQMTGATHFNEVFFDNVRIPASDIVGAPGDGWRLAVADLMNERASTTAKTAEKGSRTAPIATHLDLARSRGLLGDALTRQMLMDLLIHVSVVELLGVRLREQSRAATAPGPEGSLGKLAQAQVRQRSAAVAIRLAGPAGIAWQGAGGRGQVATVMTLSAPSASIAGGTNEIMRNIIGERVLGLPKEPQTDRDLPFSEIPR